VYETEMIGDDLVLKRKNGWCVYRDKVEGCTIYGRAPIACQAFDCREMVGAGMLPDEEINCDNLEVIRMGRILSELINPIPEK
jgi:Fe-S-cluster containining protein